MINLPIMMLCKKLLLMVGLQLAFSSPALKAENAPAVHLIPSPVNRVLVVRLKNKTAGLGSAVEPILERFIGLFRRT